MNPILSLPKFSDSEISNLNELGKKLSSRDIDTYLDGYLTGSPDILRLKKTPLGNPITAIKAGTALLNLQGRIKRDNHLPEWDEKRKSHYTEFQKGPVHALKVLVKEHHRDGDQFIDRGLISKKDLEDPNMDQKVVSDLLKKHGYKPGIGIDKQKSVIRSFIKDKESDPIKDILFKRVSNYGSKYKRLISIASAVDTIQNL